LRAILAEWNEYNEIWLRIKVSKFRQTSHVGREQDQLLFGTPQSVVNMASIRWYNYRPYLLVKRGSTFGKKVLQYEETGLKVSVSVYGVHALPYST